MKKTNGFPPKGLVLPLAAGLLLGACNVSSPHNVRADTAARAAPGTLDKAATTADGAPSGIADTAAATLDTSGPSPGGRSLGGTPSPGVRSLGGAPSPGARSLGGTPSPGARSLGGAPSPGGRSLGGAPPVVGPPPAPGASPIPGVPPIPGAPPTPQGIFLVKEAILALSVQDLSASGHRLKRWLEADGGYYTEWSQGQEGDSLRLSLTAKVPAERFEGFKDSVESLGVLEVEVAGASDVTDDYYVDLGKRSVQERIRGQYDQIGQRARRSEDALSAQEHSEALQTSAEEAAENLAKLRRQVNTSTVHLTLSQPHVPPVAPAPGFAPRFWSNLGQGWRGVEAVILFFTLLWPLALIAGAALFVVRAIRRP